MSKHPLFMTANLLLAGTSAMAGDVLQIDTVTSTISGYFEQSCGSGGDSFSQTVNDFAQFPIAIDELVDCGVLGSLESSTDGTLSDEGFEMRVSTYAGGNEGFGEYVSAYSNNETVVSFTILIAAAERSHFVVQVETLLLHCLQ